MSKFAQGDKAQAIVNENEAERLFEMRMEEKRNMKDLRLLDHWMGCIPRAVTTALLGGTFSRFLMKTAAAW